MSKRELVTELHKAARRNYTRRKVTLKGLHDLWEIDLVEMIPYKKENRGYAYILMVINGFSKMGYAEPLKSKKGADVTSAFQTILNRAGSKPKLLHSDRGTEFYNTHFSNLLKKHNIHHYSTYSEKKGSIIERWNRTIKQWMWQEFSLRGNFKWHDILQDIVTRYNNTKHRTIHMKPIDVQLSDESRLLLTVYHKKTPLTRLKAKNFQVGDNVRISRHKALFEKGYLPNWSSEVFRIVTIQPTRPITYLLEDWLKKPIAGSFYKEELQKTSVPDIFLVEKVLKTLKDQAYVKWLGFKDPTWIKKTDIL